MILKIESQESRHCSRCGKTQASTEFSRDKSKASGYKSHCRTCRKATAGSRKPEDPVRAKARRRKYNVDNAEKIKAYKAAYYENTREKWRQYSAEKLRSCPNLWWEADYRVRAEKYGFTPDIKPFTRGDLVDRYGESCFHCGGEFEELDHHPVPVGLGGKHSLDNCKPSCTACNRAQGPRVSREMREGARA